MLFGTLDTSDSPNNVILEQITGLTINSPFTKFDFSNPSIFGSSSCPTSVQNNGQQVLKFGYDVSTGCTLQLNRTELMQLCCVGNGNCANPPTSNGFVDSSSGIPFFLNFEPG